MVPRTIAVRSSAAKLYFCSPRSKRAKSSTLTSVRMFSELLAEGKVQDEARKRQFLQIITAEASRLTRLINNVLAFARLERGEQKYNFAALDLTAMVRGTIEAYRPHLESNGFTLESDLPKEPL